MITKDGSSRIKIFNNNKIIKRFLSICIFLKLQRITEKWPGFCLKQDLEGNLWESGNASCCYVFILGTWRLSAPDLPIWSLIHHHYLTQLKPNSPFSTHTAYSWSHQELFLFSLENEWEFLKSMALGIFSAYSEVIGILYRKLRFWTTFFLTSSLLCKEAVVFSLRNSHSSASCSRKYFNNLHCVLGTGYSSVSRKQAFLNALFTLSTKKN